MSYVRLPQRRLAGLGGEAWVLPAPLDSARSCSMLPVSGQVVIFPGSNVWLIENYSPAVYPASSELVTERIRAMLHFTGITIESIRLSGPAPELGVPVSQTFTSPSVTATCATCSPLYALVKFNYSGPKTLSTIWPVWTTTAGYCNASVVALLLREAGSANAPAGPTPVGPTPVGPKPVGPTPVGPTPAKPGTTSPATEEPKQATNWLVPAAVAAVVLGGLYWYTSRPPRAPSAP